LWQQQMTASDVHLAAGSTQLITVTPSARLVEVSDLATGKREKAAGFPDLLTRGTVHPICMGSASSGPLFVYMDYEKRTVALDPATMQTIEVLWKHWGPRGAYGPLQMQATPNGAALVGWGGWAGIEVAAFQQGRQLGSLENTDYRQKAFALPSADGRFLLTPAGIASRGGGGARAVPLERAYLVPAHEPGFFVALPTEGRRELPGAPGRGGKVDLPPVSQAVFCTEDGQPVFTLKGDDWQAGSNLSWEKCVHYYPRTRLLVTLVNKDRLRLRRFE
jgi:hypothetical protein